MKVHFGAVVGLVALVALAGCAGSSGSSTSSTTTYTQATSTANIYVIQKSTTQQAVLQFPVTANGSAIPATTLTPAGMTYVDAVATDSAGEIFVGGTTPTGIGEVLVFAAGASGSPTPLRTITGGGATTTTTFAVPQSMVVGANGVLYVLSTGATVPYSVAEFPSTASGAATPTAYLQGTLTGLTDPLGIAADPVGNVYISNFSSSGTTYSGQILVFASGATGNTAPSRMITSSQVLYGVAVDSSLNIYATADSATAATAGSIVQYGVGASGAATPVRTITGAATTFYFGGGIRVDSTGYVYAVNAVNPMSSTVQSVLGFAPAATGNVAPTSTFTSSSWLNGGSELAIK